MLAYTYLEHGIFHLTEKEKPRLLHPQDAIVRVTLASICTATCTSSMAASPGLYRGSLWATRWWAWWMQ